MLLFADYQISQQNLILNSFSLNDFLPKIVFGGYGNTKMVIRKRIQNYPMKEIELSSVISELRPMKVLIEVGKGKVQ